LSCQLVAKGLPDLIDALDDDAFRFSEFRRVEEHVGKSVTILRGVGIFPTS
jgi:hypothetical protein